MTNKIIKILISGEGGQGVQIMAKIISKSLYEMGYNVVFLPHYGVEMRMGISMAYLQFSSEEISNPKFETASYVVAMTSRDMKLTKSFIGKRTILINGMNLLDVLENNELTKRTLNMFVLGILSKELKTKFKIDTSKIKENIKKYLKNKNGLEKNIDAFMLGINANKKDYKKDLRQHPRVDLGAVKKEDKGKDYSHWPSHCKGCGLCIDVCPVGALKFSKIRKNYFGAPIPEVDLDKCIACNKCEQICPDAAIKVLKKKRK